MAPVPEFKIYINELISKNKVMIFSKSTCSFCWEVIDLMKSLNITFEVLQLNETDDGPSIQATLADMTGQRTVPNVFINGRHIGGCDDTLKLHQTGALEPLVKDGIQYDYDLIVIGGGSGGLSAAKEAGKLGAKVACFDFVKPSPLGTTWGLGGTCVNVGCIPKKLMHQAALLQQSLKDSRAFGWEIPESVQHNWITMKDAIQDHVRSLNWGYRVALREKNVQYFNSYAEFTGPHQIKAVSKFGKVTEVTGNKFILCTGERPRYPDIPGAKDFCITSDDLFSLEYCPGKTLVIGASYVALECAGFIAGLGLDVTVMVRSILLRGFDQQMAEIVGDFMVSHGVKFQRGYVPVKIEQIEGGQPGRLRVTSKPTNGSGPEVTEEYNTVLLGIGRDPCTNSLGLENIGVKKDKSGYVIGNEAEQTSVDNIYAVGDILSGSPKLTPVAIQAGKLLARRLFDGASTLTDYTKVATTVFTPLEYGCIGYSEEDARAKFGDENIEAYHKNFKPLEWTIPGLPDNACYAKIVVHIPDKDRVLGLHVVGPNAGEITQGYAVAMKLNATKADFDMTIGIHPTCSEIFTKMDISKSSGLSSLQTGC